MKGESRQSTRDLRSNAHARKRELKSQYKWNPGWSKGSGIPASKTDSNGTVHPRPFHTQGCQRADRSCNAKEIHKGHQLKKQLPLGNENDNVFDMLRDEDYLGGKEAGSSGSNSPSPGDDGGENGILYSYDAKEGPANGKQVLNRVFDKAVKDFEDGQTTRLVNDQYDVIDSEADTEAGPSSTTVEDGDYEMI